MTEHASSRPLTERERWTLTDLHEAVVHCGEPQHSAVLAGVRVGCLSSLKRLGLTAQDDQRRWYVTEAGVAAYDAIRRQRRAGVLKRAERAELQRQRDRRRAAQLAEIVALRSQLAERERRYRLDSDAA